MSNPDQPSSVVPARPVNRLRPAVALFCLVLACGGKKPADNATGPTGGDDRGSDSGGQQSGANSTANGNGAGASSTGTGGANGQRASSSANARIALGVQAGSPLGDHAHVVIDDGSGGAYVGHLVRRDRKDVVNTRPGDRRLVLEGAEGAYISHYGADYHRQTRFILEDIHFIDAIARHPGSGDLFIAAEEHYYPRKQKQTRLRLLHYTRDGVKRSHDLDKKLLTKLPKRPQQHRIADLTIDDTGDLYAAVEVTRRSRKRGRAGDVELAVARISTTGAIRWYQRIAAKGERSQDGLTAIALTPTGQVVVAGHTGGTLAGAEASRGDLDLFVQVYDGDSGKLQWTSTHGTDKREQAHDVAVAADGSIVLVGSTAGQLFGAPRGDDDALILTVGKDGAQAWGEQLGTGHADVFHAVTITGKGAILAIGETHGQLTLERPTSGDSGIDVLLAGYTPAGIRSWMFQTGTDKPDHAAAIAASAKGGAHALFDTLGSFQGMGQRATPGKPPPRDMVLLRIRD